jgi:hypothetical protein
MNFALITDSSAVRSQLTKPDRRKAGEILANSGNQASTCNHTSTNASSGNRMVVPGTPFRCGFAIESIDQAIDD